MIKDLYDFQVMNLIIDHNLEKHNIYAYDKLTRMTYNLLEVTVSTILELFNLCRDISNRIVFFEIVGGGGNNE